VRRLVYGFFAATLLALVGAALASTDASGWRGPGRDGLLASFDAPTAWPAGLTQRWQVEVGEGHASPVVAGEQVFVLSRKGADEVVSALALADGKVLWQKSYPAPYQVNPAAAAHGPGPKSTPAVGDGRLFTLGIGGILTAWDAKTGEVLWRQDFAGRFKTTSPLFGTAMSPLLDGRTLIVDVGGHDSGALLGLDAATGKELWSRPEDGPGYASPVVGELGGVRQLVTLTQGHVVGVNVASGELLWQIPFDTEYFQNTVTPVVYRDLVIFSGIEKPVVAVRPAREGGRWKTTEVWRNADFPLYMSSPVLLGDRLCGMSHKKKGQLFCLDAATGKTLWSDEGRRGSNAALWASGDTLLVLGADADLWIFQAAPASVREIAHYEAAKSSTWASPAIAGDRILVKDVKALTLWSWK
jgi:outer membrane protein assembly factor BamB